MVNEYEYRVGDKVLLADMEWNSYDWHIFGLFRDDAGRLYTAEDSGCSCNSPWEDEEYLDFSPVANVQEALQRARRVVDYDSAFSTADYEAFAKEALAIGGK